MLNLQNSGSLQDAKTRQWGFITSLKNAVGVPAVIYSNGQLLIVGATGSTSSTRRDVQYLSLASNTTGVYAGTIDHGKYSAGLEYPGMFNTAAENVSIFGGYEASKNCIQQTTPGKISNSRWECLTSSESALEGLKRRYGYSDSIRYTNFVARGD